MAADACRRHYAVVEAQNQLTQTVVAQCETRDEFKELMTRLYNYERYGCPYKCVFCLWPRCLSHICSNRGIKQGKAAQSSLTRLAGS